MNRHDSDYDQNRWQHSDEEFHTRRSERYRHPEQQHSTYSPQQERRGSYVSPDQGQYRSRSNYGFQGDALGGYGSQLDQDNSYSSSRNYGNMGSYGGAQGYGSSRGGYGSQHNQHDNDSRFYDSGRRNMYDNNRNSGYAGSQRYGGTSGYSNQGWEDNRGSRGNQFNRGSNRTSASQDLYGSDTSRRFQGSRQNSYDFNDSDYNSYRDRNQEAGYGYYMGSNSDRISRGDYGSNDGNYGSLRRPGEEQNKPYGLSGYYSGGYGEQGF
ncbi:hypothetical protein ACMA1I_03845 [Pontibacter sp. 13R65]|uniref:hypothetical protein n=1 Tax=Pontibacter sp. 13R65 TaxID=3127458 RepID=UPI00301E36F8